MPNSIRIGSKWKRNADDGREYVVTFSSEDWYGTGAKIVLVSTDNKIRVHCNNTQMRVHWTEVKEAK